MHRVPKDVSEALPGLGRRTLPVQRNPWAGVRVAMCQSIPTARCFVCAATPGVTDSRVPTVCQGKGMCFWPVERFFRIACPTRCVKAGTGPGSVGFPSGRRQWWAKAAEGKRRRRKRVFYHAGRLVCGACEEDGGDRRARRHRGWDGAGGLAVVVVTSPGYCSRPVSWAALPRLFASVWRRRDSRLTRRRALAGQTATQAGA